MATAFKDWELVCCIDRSWVMLELAAQLQPIFMGFSKVSVFTSRGATQPLHDRIKFFLQRPFYLAVFCSLSAISSITNFRAMFRGRLSASRTSAAFVLFHFSEHSSLSMTLILPQISQKIFWLSLYVLAVQLAKTTTSNVPLSPFLRLRCIFRFFNWGFNST